MDLEINDKNNLLENKYLKEVEELVELGGQKVGLNDDTEMSISFISDEEIHRINKEYRDKDRVTDVISFAIEDNEDPNILKAFKDEGITRDLGDLFIAPNFVFERAKELNHSKERELGYTVIHGLLHLSGYDHQTSLEEAEMITLQEDILETYGLKK